MDMKYDKMVEVTQEESKKKIWIAKKTIADMLENKERITVSELVRRTGLSRGFFYKNQTVRTEMDDAMHRQEISKNQLPKIEKGVIDSTIALSMEILKVKESNEELLNQNNELLRKNEQLQAEVERLQRRLARKEITLLKGI